jgi:hypothetical protein
LLRGVYPDRRKGSQRHLHVKSEVPKIRDPIIWIARHLGLIKADIPFQEQAIPESWKRKSNLFYLKIMPRAPRVPRG